MQSGFSQEMGECNAITNVRVLHRKPLPLDGKSPFLKYYICRLLLGTLILADYRVHRDELWKQFNATKDEELWYYRELVRAFKERASSGVATGQLVEEFERVVCQLEELASQKARTV